MILMSSLAHARSSQASTNADPLSTFCARPRYVAAAAGSRRPGRREGDARRRRPYNDQSEASQLSRDWSVCQIGLVRDPAEAPGGSTARSASCLVLVLISA